MVYGFRVVGFGWLSGLGFLWDLSQGIVELYGVSVFLLGEVGFYSVTYS